MRHLPKYAFHTTHSDNVSDMLKLNALVTYIQHLHELDIHHKEMNMRLLSQHFTRHNLIPTGTHFGGESFVPILSFSASLISRCRQLGFPSVLSLSRLLFTSSPPIPRSSPYLQLEISRVLVDPPSSSNFSNRQRDTTVFTHLPS